jgi:hypothetical protein
MIAIPNTNKLMGAEFMFHGPTYQDGCFVRRMESILLLCSRMGKPKQLHKLSEYNLLSFAQTHENDQQDSLHHRINRWLRDSSDASTRHGWGLRACFTCLHPRYISDFELTEPELEYLLPRRNSDAFSE